MFVKDRVIKCVENNGALSFAELDRILGWVKTETIRIAVDQLVDSGKLAVKDDEYVLM